MCKCVCVCVLCCYERGARIQVTLKLMFPLVSSRLLLGTCSAVIKGYWTFEWCHGKEIRQFHLDVFDPKQHSHISKIPEHRKFVNVNGKKMVKTTDWSLGIHNTDESGNILWTEPPSTVEEKAAAAARALNPERTIFREDPAGVVWRNKEKRPVHRQAAHLEVFEDGQWCDETQTDRSSTVHMMCCDDDGASVPDSPTGASSSAGEGGSSGGNDENEMDPASAQSKKNEVRIKDVDEVAICKYRIRVCVPMLCEPLKAKARALGSEGAKRSAQKAAKRKKEQAATAKKKKKEDEKKKKKKDKKKEKKKKATKKTKRKCTAAEAAEMAAAAAAGGASSGGVMAEEASPFYGLIWPNLVSKDSDDFQWVASLDAVTGATPEARRR